jgi:hypothetical protein
VQEDDSVKRIRMGRNFPTHRYKFTEQRNRVQGRDQCDSDVTGAGGRYDDNDDDDDDGDTLLSVPLV